MIIDRPGPRCGRWWLRRHTRTGLELPAQTALAELLNRRLQSRPATAITRTRFGASVPVTTSDLIQRYLYMFGVWEPHLTHWLTRRIRPGDTVIDVGANIGYFTLLAAHLTGLDGRVVAIEAAPEMHRTLNAVVRANRADVVRTVHAAVSNAPGRVTFYQPDPGNLGATSMIAPRRRGRPLFEVDAYPLIDLLSSDELTTARIVKIDVEGAEGAAVSSLEPHLNRLRRGAELVIEVSPGLLSRQSRSIDDIAAPLLAHGFHPYLLTNDYRACSYPGAIRNPRPPQRLRTFSGLRDPSDLLFSRTEAEYLS